MPLPRWILPLLLTLGAGAASAQLRLPGGVVGGALDRLQPLAPALRQPLAPVTESLREQVPLQALRQRTVRELLRQHRGRLEADPAGEPVVRAQLLLVAPSAELLDASRAQGFTLLRDTVLDGLGLRTVLLQAPGGLDTAEALQRLRAADPQLEVDFNHLLLPSGAVAAANDAGPPASTPIAARRAGDAPRVGLVDSGVDSAHSDFAGHTPMRWGCNGQDRPAAHGTAVASLLRAAGGERTQIFAADVYCGRPEGGNVDEVVQALAWLAREQVAVINLSLVGPHNRVLERAVQALLRRGHVLVAAVGNDGPAAPPLFPAAYAGVVGVTAVNGNDSVLPEAGRGPQVMLAAPGAGLPAARAGARGHADVRGTSFAAPLVAGLLARGLAAPQPAAAQQAVDGLVHEARDLGEPGRDPVYGFGLVAAPLRATLAAWARR